MSATTRLAALGLAVGSVLLLAGCATALRDAEGVLIATDPAADPFSVQVGDCLGIAGSGDPGTDDTESVDTVELVPCAGAHYWEAYASTPVPVDETDGAVAFPGDEALAELGIAACQAQFEGFVGSAWDASALEVRFFLPTSASWEMGDREILCLVGTPDEATTGTLGDSGL